MIREKGFTLIEVIIVITILALVISALAGLLESGLFSWDRVNHQAELQQNLRLALDNIIKDIKRSKKIAAGSTNSQIILVISDTETITYGLKTDDYLDQHPYNMDGQVLYRMENTGNKLPIAYYIANLDFRYKYEATIEDTTFVTVGIEGVLPNGKSITFQSGAELKWKSFGSLTE